MQAMLQGAHRPETNGVLGMDASMKSTEQGILGQSTLTKDVNANKATIESIKTDRQDIKLLLISLYAGNTPEFIKLKSQLERLYDDLGGPINERVLELNGIGSWMNHLQPASKDELGQLPSEVRNSPESTAGGNVELHGAALDIVRGRAFREEIKNWQALKKALVELPAKPNFAYQYNDFIEGRFRLKFLKCLYLIEQLIHKYDLLPTHLIGDVDLFEQKTLLKMIEYHTELLFKRNNIGFFGIPDSIIPQLEFLKTGRALRHFHSPIAALSAANQRYAVYLVLSVIIRHAPWKLGRSWENLRPSDRFEEIRTSFTHDDFLQKVHALSDALSKTPHQNHLPRNEYLPVVSLVNHALDFFQRPSLLKETDSDRLEFLVVYYILDFMDQFYRPIVTEILRNKSHPELFDKQLKFMRGNLKFYQNRVEGPNYPDEKQDMAFLETYKSSLYEDGRLHGWIKAVANDLMQQNLPYHGKKPFTLWMDRNCYNCLYPLGKCYQYCGL
ncbi:hypothetical protein Pst134EB_001860 [Puccinia striiformis f. sp. tritici]|nr:hypothetical protein Pst134EB_001860 [Puccinia striiformis f. sp. tritici]